MGLVIRLAVVWQSKNFEPIIKKETMAMKMSNNGMVRFLQYRFLKELPEQLGGNLSNQYRFLKELPEQLGGNLSNVN